MKLKYKIWILRFSLKFLMLLALWFILPYISEKIVHQSAHRDLIEKKKKFLKHLDRKEINDFLIAKDTDEVFGSFSTLHSEFFQLYAIRHNKKLQEDTIFVERRIIEDEESNFKILRHHFKYGDINYALEIGSNIDQIDRLRTMIHLYLGIIFLVLLLVSFFVDSFFLNKILEPFYKILHTKLIAGSDPDQFNMEPVESNTLEFKKLDEALNDMMQRVTIVFKKRKQFISNISHELLTPIGLLRNRFENLLQNRSLDGDAIDKIADSITTLDSLKDTINSLLFLSKIENEQFKTNEQVNINEIVMESVETLSDWVESKNINVINKMTHNEIIYGNRSLLKTMINNFMTNAIKYNQENGNIIISDGMDEGKYHLTISDTGCGMDTEQQKNIFDRFSRVNFSEDGHGLGLAIAQSIASLHKISIAVESELGKGSNFILFFPLN